MYINDLPLCQICNDPLILSIKPKAIENFHTSVLLYLKYHNNITCTDVTYLSKIYYHTGT
jgi:hypothetical protein